MKFYLYIGLSALFVFLTFVVLAMKILYPYHRYLALAVYLVSWIPLFLSLRYRPELLERLGSASKSFLVSSGAYIGLAIALFLLSYALFVLVPTEKSALSEMSDEEIQMHLTQDTESLLILKKENDATLEIIENSELFQKNIQELSYEQKGEIKKIWRHFLEISFEIDLIREKYRGFTQIDFVQKPILHSKAFLLSYFALTIEYEGAFRLSQNIRDDGLISSYLNQEDIEFLLPKDTYFQIKRKLTSPKEILRLNAGRAYLRLVEKYLTEDQKLLSYVRENIKHIESNILKFPKLFVKNPLEFLEKESLSLWLPAQKKIALNLSYIRTSRRDYFISPETIQGKQELFEPGDIFLERREWHATNIGIPGFWTHAALYTGTLEEIDRYFSEIPLEKNQKPSEYIEEKYPHVFREFQKKDSNGFAKRVTEAKRAGVILTSLEYTANADSLGVLRVQTSKEEKFKALLSAFSYYGKPYDYDFNFLSDSAVVCSELVYKAYQQNKDITFSLESINGRLMLPPNNIAKKYDEEFDSDNGSLELVLFLDGNEKKKVAAERDEMAFRKTWNRPKWYIFGEYIKGSLPEEDLYVQNLFQRQGA